MNQEPTTFPELLEKYLELKEKLENEYPDERYNSIRTAISTIEQKIKDYVISGEDVLQLFEGGIEIETPDYKRLQKEHGEIKDKLEDLEEKYNLSEGKEESALTILQELETQRDSLIGSLEKLTKDKKGAIIDDLQKIIGNYKQSSN